MRLYLGFQSDCFSFTPRGYSDGLDPSSRIVLAKSAIAPDHVGHVHSVSVSGMLQAGLKCMELLPLPQAVPSSGSSNSFDPFELVKP